MFFVRFCTLLSLNAAGISGTANYDYEWSFSGNTMIGYHVTVTLYFENGMTHSQTFETPDRAAGSFRMTEYANLEKMKCVAEGNDENIIPGGWIGVIKNVALLPLNTAINIIITPNNGIPYSYNVDSLGCYKKNIRPDMWEKAHLSCKVQTLYVLCDLLRYEYMWRKPKNAAEMDSVITMTIRYKDGTDRIIERRKIYQTEQSLDQTYRGVFGTGPQKGLLRLIIECLGDSNIVIKDFRVTHKDGELASHMSNYEFKCYESRKNNFPLETECAKPGYEIEHNTCTECSDERYGQNCRHSCSACKHGCNNVRGDCLVYSCSDFQMSGRYCNISCNNGKYNPYKMNKCWESCYCINGEQCRGTDGYCRNGCAWPYYNVGKPVGKPYCNKLRSTLKTPMITTSTTSTTTTTTPTTTSTTTTTTTPSTTTSPPTTTTIAIKAPTSRTNPTTSTSTVSETSKTTSFQIIKTRDEPGSTQASATKMAGKSTVAIIIGGITVSVLLAFIAFMFVAHRRRHVNSNLETMIKSYGDLLSNERNAQNGGCQIEEEVEYVYTDDPPVATEHQHRIAATQSRGPDISPRRPSRYRNITQPTEFTPVALSKRPSQITHVTTSHVRRRGRRDDTASTRRRSQIHDESYIDDTVVTRRVGESVRKQDTIVSG